MPTKKELNDEANELNLKWRREERRREEAETALRNLVAAAEKVLLETHDLIERDLATNVLVKAVTAAKEALK